MRRTGLILIAILLAMPIVHECCIPAAPAHHCHQSQDPAQPPCTSNPVAVAADKTGAQSFIVDFGFAFDRNGNSTAFDFAKSAADEPAFSRPDIPIDRYLRTSALLI
jgi:hypothetical protein